MENITSPENEKPARNKKFSPAVLTFILIIALIGTACFVLTNSVKFLIAAALIIIICMVGNKADKNDLQNRIKNIIGRILALIIILFFMFSIPSITISSSSLWKYPFQSFYIGLYRNVKEPAWFPDFRNDVQSGYSFEYIPSIMQGTGHYSVCFVTSSEIAAEYEKEFASQARYIIPLDEYSSHEGWYTIGEDKDDSGNNVLDVYWNMDFWEKSGEPNAQIYVLDAVLNWNHPHSSAVIIDTESGRVQLSQLG